MDIVLDCLKDEFVDASLRLLPRGGRFIEIGKADIRDPDEVAARYPGVQYHAFDLVEDVDHDLGPGMFGELLRHFEAGESEPVPVCSWDIRQASDTLPIPSAAHGTPASSVFAVPRAARSGGYGADHRRYRRPGDAARPASGGPPRRTQPVWL